MVFHPTDLLRLRVDDDQVSALVGADLLRLRPTRGLRREGVTAFLEGLPTGRALLVIRDRSADQRWEDGGKKNPEKNTKPRKKFRFSPPGKTSTASSARWYLKIGVNHPNFPSL